MKKLLLIIVILMGASSESYCQWVRSFAADDFGEKTGELVLLCNIDGVFSNSATSNSGFNGCIVFSKDRAYLRLADYGSFPTYLRLGADFVVKCGEDKKHFIITQGSGTFIICGKTQMPKKVSKTLMKILQKGNSVAYVKGSGCHYKFTIPKLDSNL